MGGSLDDSASAESVVVDASGRVVAAGFAGPAPSDSFTLWMQR